MVGNEAALCQGLQLLNGRCENSIREVNLEFRELLVPSFKNLKLVMSRSYQSLKFFSARRHGEFAGTIIFIPVRCPSLQVLGSICLEGGSAPRTTHVISPRELPKLKVLECRDKKGTLDCNASLVKILKEAKSVKVNSGSISQAFVINLLSTAIEIEELELSGTNDAVKLDSIPIMELLDLQHLSLDVVPSATEEDEVFWDYLLAPSLETLWLGSFNPLHSGLSEFGENLVAFRFHSFMQ